MRHYLSKLNNIILYHFFKYIKKFNFIISYINNMTDCNIELNFFELDDFETIKRLVNINADSLEINDLRWFPGKSGISHGGFIKKKSDTNFKGFILPKIRKLKFNKTDKKGSYNDNDDYSIPGSFALKGEGHTLRFLRLNKSKKKMIYY
jgi:hypothetical protein